MSKLQLVHTYFKSIFICRDNFVHVFFYFKQKDNLLMSIKQLIHNGPFSLYHKWVLSDVNPIVPILLLFKHWNGNDSFFSYIYKYGNSLSGTATTGA